MSVYRQYQQKGIKMGILSKLLNGDKNAEKVAKDMLNGLIDSMQSSQTPAPAPEQPASAATSQETPAAPAGIPAEENQYNFNGTFEQYFEHIFAADFPAYRIEKTYIDDYGKHRVVYTFYSDGGRALAVELMPESSEAAKFRNDCRKAGLPYLRFYYDHKGWWNTRSYVVGRIRGILHA